MNSPTISRGNNHSHPRECISHGGPRPAEGGIEIGPGRWICFHCWSRGLRSAGAFVRREAAANAEVAKRSEVDANAAPITEFRIDLVAQSLLGTTACDWSLEVPSRAPRPHKTRESA